MKKILLVIVLGLVVTSSAKAQNWRLAFEQMAALVALNETCNLDIIPERAAAMAINSADEMGWSQAHREQMFQTDMLLSRMEYKAQPERTCLQALLYRNSNNATKNFLMGKN